MFLLAANMERLPVGIKKWKKIRSTDDWEFRFLFFVIAILNLFT